jgi:hypothetical protein
VDLDLHSQSSEYVSGNEEQGSGVLALEEGYKPSFMKLTMNETGNLAERDG